MPGMGLFLRLAFVNEVFGLGLMSRVRHTALMPQVWAFMRNVQATQTQPYPPSLNVVGGGGDSDALESCVVVEVPILVGQLVM